MAQRDSYYSARLTRGGPLVGVHVWFGPPLIDGEEMDRSPRWQALIDTETTGRPVHQFADDGAPLDVDGVTLREPAPINEALYRFLIERARWAQKHAPHHPSASPRDAIDLRGLRSLF